MTSPYDDMTRQDLLDRIDDLERENTDLANTVNALRLGLESCTARRLQAEKDRNAAVAAGLFLQKQLDAAREESRLVESARRQAMNALRTTELELDRLQRLIVWAFVGAKIVPTVLGEHWNAIEAEYHELANLPPR